jgi:hypothetical protein
MDENFTTQRRIPGRTPAGVDGGGDAVVLVAGDEPGGEPPRGVFLVGVGQAEGEEELASGISGADIERAFGRATVALAFLVADRRVAQDDRKLARRVVLRAEDQPPRALMDDDGDPSRERGAPITTAPRLLSPTRLPR